MAKGWLVEEGIGEDRAIRLNGSTICDCLLEWHGDLRPGQIEAATLESRISGTQRGLARFANREQALVDRLPADAAEGASIRLEVTRGAIMEERRNKLAQARPSAQDPKPASSLAQRLRQSGYDVQIVRRFPDCDWDELIGEALDRRVAFAGGNLHFSPTPAMTLIDVDTSLSPERGALAAATPIAHAIRRFGLGGSIGIDFPTLASKASRRTVDDALGLALGGWPHERTAMNGFGFVQLVARLERPSLLHVLLYRRSRAMIYRLLRQAEQLEGTGAIEMSGEASLFDIYLDPEMIDELRRRTGREIRVKAEERLASLAPHVQLVPL